MIRAFNVFGTVGNIERIEVDNDYVKDERFASFNHETHTILLRSDRGRAGTAVAVKTSNRQFSTESGLHPYHHEIGHALWDYLKRSDGDFLDKMLKVYTDNFIKTKRGVTLLSEYAKENASEMFAEAIAEILNGTPGELSKRILADIQGRTYDE